MLFLTGGEGKRVASHSASQQRPSTRVSRKSRDTGLESHAAALLSPLAPALASSVIVGWNPCMRTTAGVALVTRNEVWLNPALRDVPGDEVDQTLRHELAHLLAQHRSGRRRIAPHGPEWRQACVDLGIGGEERTHRLPFEGRRLRRRFSLVCPACGDSHGRVRPPRRALACLACCRRHNGGLYDARFRLRVEVAEAAGAAEG